MSGNGEKSLIYGDLWLYVSQIKNSALN